MVVSQPPTGGPPLGLWQGYSLAERDRRWQAVRAGAAAAGLDCLFVPLGNGTDARYLTQFRSAAIVLPTDGRPPIVVTDRGGRNAWVPEPRHTSRAWAEPMVQALLDAGMERARIGVVGLRGGTLTHVRSPDGVVVHSAFAAVVRRLPHATFVDATDVVGRVRAIKSDEESGYLRQAAAVAEAGIATLIATARPGVDAAVLYAEVMGALLERGSEYYPLALYVGPVDGPPSRRYTDPPLGVRLAPNTLVTSEVSAVVGAQVAQEDQPVLLGPVPEAWKPVIALQREVFEAGLARMRPGTLFGDLIDFVNGFGARRGLRTRILMHGRGLGDDGPLLSPRAPGDAVRGLPIEQGMTFVWKPTAASADGRITFTWGGDVLVTESGAVPLFQRSHGLVTVP
jgi:Xaa-Pro aminopeptidase